jgi:hypothetical protein
VVHVEERDHQRLPAASCPGDFAFQLHQSCGPAVYPGQPIQRRIVSVLGGLPPVSRCSVTFLFGSAAFAGSSSAISQRSAAIQQCEIAFVGSSTAISRGPIAVLFGSASFPGTCLAVLPRPSPVTSSLSPSHLRPAQGLGCDPVADRHREPVAGLILVIGQLVPLVGRLITLIGRLITLPSGVITQIGSDVSPITSPIPSVTTLITTGPNLIAPISSCVALGPRLVPLCADHIPALSGRVTLSTGWLSPAGGSALRLPSRVVTHQALVNLANTAPMKEREPRCATSMPAAVSAAFDFERSPSQPLNRSAGASSRAVFQASSHAEVDPPKPGRLLHDGALS